jgi:putative transposase
MRDWPHAPTHLLAAAGAYMVTAATYRKTPIYSSRERLDLLLRLFETLALKYQIAAQAWAFFPNHYHFIAMLADSTELPSFIRHFHSVAAREVNRLDKTSGRQVWFQYWDTHLTFERSYFARLRYVHENAVHHVVVRVAPQYPWCSAGWFEQRAAPAFRNTVLNFPCDKLDVPDAFDVQMGDLSPVSR